MARLPAELVLVALLGCASGTITDGLHVASCSAGGKAACTACLEDQLPDPNAPLPGGCVRVEGGGLTGNATSAITSALGYLAGTIWPF